MNASINAHGTLHHRHNAGFWPASTLRVVCLDDDTDSQATDLQLLFPSDSFSLSSTSGDGESVSIISQDSLLQPFELDTSTTSHDHYSNASIRGQHKNKIPALITFLSSLATPPKSNTTKTHKRNQKLRGSFSLLGNLVVSNEASSNATNPEFGFMPSSSPFHPVFPRQVQDTNKTTSSKVAIGIIPEPTDD